MKKNPIYDKPKHIENCDDYYGTKVTAFFYVGDKIKEGMVFCIEPMICQKDGEPRILEDDWSVVSVDGLKGSHYEHTVAIINGKAEILSVE